MLWMRLVLVSETMMVVATWIILRSRVQLGRLLFAVPLKETEGSNSQLSSVLVDLAQLGLKSPLSSL